MNSMPAELYFRETADLARRHGALLDEARQIMAAGESLSDLETNGVLHTLQVLIENAIGKAKQTLKLAGEPVPTSAYDTMRAMVRINQIDAGHFSHWAAIIGLRNRIVHEYMNLDVDRVLQLVRDRDYMLVLDFLLAPVDLEQR